MNRRTCVFCSFVSFVVRGFLFVQARTVKRLRVVLAEQKGPYAPADHPFSYPVSYIATMFSAGPTT